MGYNDRRWGSDDDRYGRDRGGYGRPSGNDRNDRGFFDRAGDEVRSWFGDEEAERRRQYDERYDDRYGRGGERGRDYDTRGDYREGGTYGRSQGSFGGRDDSRGRYGSDAPVSGYGWSGGDGSRGQYGQDQYGQGGRYGQDYGRSQGQSRQGSQGSHHDESYGSWRDRQMQSFDSDYHDYRRENQSRFENEFSTYRTRRQGQRDLLQKVSEHDEVLGSDGQHVGKVDHVRGDRIKLTKNDQAAGGHHHTIPSSWIEKVEDNKVTIGKTADEAKRAWREEQDEDRNRGGGLFGGSDDGDRVTGDRNLNRSFSGTY